MKTRFVLIETSHAGNVGAAARALKTMGFDDLVLVRPRWPNVLRKEETIQRASGALDVLGNARVVETLEEALDGISHLCATAMTPRDFGPPTRTPRQHFELLLSGALDVLAAPDETAPTADASVSAPAPTPRCNQSGVAFLFGCERFGMSNDDVYRSDVALSIPSNPQFGSLNLGAAIQVVAYEWWSTRLRRSAPTRPRWPACWATGSRRWRISAFWIRLRPRSSCRASTSFSTARN